MYSIAIALSLFPWNDNFINFQRIKSFQKTLQECHAGMMMVLFLGEVQGRYCYHQWGLDDAERGRLFRELHAVAWACNFIHSGTICTYVLIMVYIKIPMLTKDMFLFVFE